MSSIIKVDTIQKADGTAGTIENLGLATGALSHRNLIINGDMRIAQRGTSVTGLGSGGGYYAGADRMRRSVTSTGSGAFTREQSTDAPEDFSYSLKETTTTVSDGNTNEGYRPLNIRIEGQDLQHLEWGTSAAKSITFSFWVKSSVTGTYSMTIVSYDSSNNADIITNTYTINSASTWEYKTVTFVGNTSANIRNTNSYGLDIQWCAGSGSDFTGTDSTSWGDYATGGYHYGQTANVCGTLNATWQITGVQLEVGSVATPFEHRSYGEELTRCERYYQILGGQAAGNDNGCGMIPMTGWGGSNAYGVYRFPTEMRTSPSLYTNNLPRLYMNNNSLTVSSIDLNSNETNSRGGRISIYFSGASNTADNRSGWLQGTSTNSTEIQFDAEL